MAKGVFGAFSMLVVVNDQDVRVSCSVCGTIRDSTVDRSPATEAAMRLHIESHIRFIDRGRGTLPSTFPGQDNGDGH